MEALLGFIIVFSIVFVLVAGFYRGTQHAKRLGRILEAADPKNKTPPA